MPVHPSYLNFDKPSYAWKPDIDYRKNPSLYQIGKGEQGVLICQPYKGEIGSNWRFKTKVVAEVSAKKIYEQFLDYLSNNEFVGADMARKYLQMGYTRSRRYANYKGGKKYDETRNYAQLERGTGEQEKAEAANVFHKYWKLAEQNEAYTMQKKKWKKAIG